MCVCVRVCVCTNIVVCVYHPGVCDNGKTSVTIPHVSTFTDCDFVILAFLFLRFVTKPQTRCPSVPKFLRDETFMDGC